MAQAFAEPTEPGVVEPQPEDAGRDVAALARERLQLAAVLPGQDFERPPHAFRLAPQTIIVEHRPLLVIAASFSAASRFGNSRSSAEPLFFSLSSLSERPAPHFT